MKTRDLKKGIVLVIGHQAAETMTIISVRPLDIEWDGENIVPKAGTAYEIAGDVGTRVPRLIALQGDDEVEVR